MRSAKFLAKCQALNAAGFKPELTVGTFVGRGFADLGFELFTYLGAGRVVSHFTGQSSQLTPLEIEKLFVVPSADDLVNEIQKHGLDVVSLEFAEQRIWRLTVKECAGHAQQRFENAFLLEVLLDCLKARLVARNVSAAAA